MNTTYNYDRYLVTLGEETQSLDGPIVIKVGESFSHDFGGFRGRKTYRVSKIVEVSSSTKIQDKKGFTAISNNCLEIILEDN